MSDINCTSVVVEMHPDSRPSRLDCNIHSTIGRSDCSREDGRELNRDFKRKQWTGGEQGVSDN